MAKFLVKTDLSYRDQQELDRILAIDSTKRTTKDANFIAALLPYQTNAVIRSHSDGDILEAEGNILPTGDSGFKQGAFFRELDRTGRNLYVNVGDNTSAVWNLVGDAVASPSASAS